MNRTRIAGLGCVLIVLAIAVAGLLHRGAQDVPADLILLHDGEQIELSLEDLQQTSFSEVRAADQYAATVTGEEICEQDRIYLAVTEDGEPVEGIDEGTPGIEMVVFGDSDSKRCVRCVVEIEMK